MPKVPRHAPRLVQAPPPLALHPRLDLCGFRVSLTSDRAHVYHSC